VGVTHAPYTRVLDSMTADGAVVAGGWRHAVLRGTRRCSVDACLSRAGDLAVRSGAFCLPARGDAPDPDRQAGRQLTRGPDSVLAALLG
jgi:hypothetical protein